MSGQKKKFSLKLLETGKAGQTDIIIKKNNTISKKYLI